MSTNTRTHFNIHTQRASDSIAYCDVYTLIHSPTLSLSLSSSDLFVYIYVCMCSSLELKAEIAVVCTNVVVYVGVRLLGLFGSHHLYLDRLFSSSHINSNSSYFSHISHIHTHTENEQISPIYYYFYIT